MKKLLAILLAAAMLFVVAGCSSNTDADSNGDNANNDSVQPEGESDGEAVTLDNIKVGFLYIGDASDGGYSYTHIEGTQKMKETLGLRDDQVIEKFNITEDAAAETAINELIDAGCNAIFGTSFGYDGYMVEAAKAHPEIQFFHASGSQCKDAGLPNAHNYFGKIYEARYLAGIAAGLKTETNVLGYVTAMPFPECISGYTAFYLGAKSVNPDVTMKVMYTNSWADATKEAQVAQALIDAGCDVLSLHADTTSTVTTAEANGVWACGYNSDMAQAAPNAVLVSAVWDWSQYLVMAINDVVGGEAVPADYTAGLKDGFVDITEPTSICADGTAEAIAEAREKIESGWNVFSGPLHGVAADGTEINLAEGEEFVEPQSAPTWAYIVDGIEVIE